MTNLPISQSVTPSALTSIKKKIKKKITRKIAGKIAGKIVKSVATKISATLLATSMTLLLLFSITAHADSSSDEPASPSVKSQIKSAQKLIYKEKYKAALKKLNEALKQDTDNADVWNLIGFASRKSGDTDAAGEAYNRALSINADHLGALEYQGELFITLGKMTDAQNNLARLAQLCPSSCEEHEDLAEAIAAAQ